MNSKVLLALPFEKLIEALSSPLLELGKQVESIPYLRGMVPTLLNQPDSWEALIVTDKILGMNPTTEGLLDFIQALETIRSERKLSHINVIVLTDLSSRHPIFREMIALGIYNLLNGPNLSIAEIVHRLNQSNSYADIQHLLQTDLSIPWPRPISSHDQRTVTVEKSIIKETTVELKQREMAVLSFYPAGASFFSMNLAAILAKRDIEVHLWDADMRNPALYYYFGLDSLSGENQSHSLIDNQNPFLQKDTMNPLLVRQGSMFVHTRQPDPMQKIYQFEDFLDFYELVRPRSQHCIMDISGGFNSPIAPSIIKQCTDVFIVLDPNVMKWIQLYETIVHWKGSVNRDKCRWILTRYDVSNKRMLRDLENLFDIQLELVLPDVTPTQYEAWMRGRPVVNHLSAQHPFVLELENYIDRFIPNPNEERWYHRWMKS